MANFVRRTMVVLVGALALWVAVPAMASAATASWVLNGRPLSESVATTWSGKVVVTDSGASQQESVECTEKGEGSVGAGAAGELTKLALSECATIKGCGATGITAEPVNLPWHTELVSVEGASRDRLVSGGKGTPGIKVECKVLGVKIPDTCSGTLGATTSNTSEGITATFSASEKLTCSIGGTNSGSLGGSQKIATTGGVLSAEAAPPNWQASGVPIKTGKNIYWSESPFGMAVGSKYGTLDVRCKDSGAGTVGETGTGTVTEFSFSKCEPVGGECNDTYPASITALHLPWKTQLAFGSKESAHLSFTEDGAGAPGFKFSCYVIPSLPVSFECDEGALPTLQPLTNQEHGVLAELYGGGLVCSKVYGSEFRETSEKLEMSNGEKLSVS
jgi:hypothetical protein